MFIGSVSQPGFCGFLGILEDPSREYCKSFETLPNKCNQCSKFGLLVVMLHVVTLCRVIEVVRTSWLTIHASPSIDLVQKLYQLKVKWMLKWKMFYFHSINGFYSKINFSENSNFVVLKKSKTNLSAYGGRAV